MFEIKYESFLRQGIEILAMKHQGLLRDKTNIKFLRLHKYPCDEISKCTFGQ